MKKILLLYGGNSYEHEISIKSINNILKNIDKKKYQITTVGIDKENNWYLINDDIELLDNNWKNLNITKINNIISFLTSFDKVFPIIHGSPLENGSLQGLFDMYNINYIGSNLSSSIISYDKELTKIICSKYNIPQVEYQTITKKDNIKHLIINYPVIIKPAKCGSSIGINIANNYKELKENINIAFKYDNKIIIEKFIKSRELECAILENKKLIVSPIGEIKPANTFYDYNSKYTLDSRLLIPSNIDISIQKEIQKLSKKIFKILNLKDLARIDFLYDYHNQKLYFNEVNTMPGFTDISMYPLLFNHMNISTKKIISFLLDS